MDNNTIDPLRLVTPMGNISKKLKNDLSKKKFCFTRV
jgi:hypothetical protein